ncbi:MAG: hypothetical protein ACOX3T_06010 [Bdellovibrionota bacterium]
MNSNLVKKIFKILEKSLYILLILVYTYFFVLRLGFEFRFPIAYDSPDFQAIGRGIVNGFYPFRDFWEVKPIGIYLLHYISYSLTDTLIISHVFLIFCYISLFLFPIIFFLIKVPRKKRTLSLFVISVALGSLVAVYADLRGGRLLPDIFGIFFSCLYILFINSSFFIKKRKLSYFIAGFLMCIACNFKEPYLFSIIASSLIFSNSFKDFLRKFFIPFLVACVLGGVFLLSLGLLKDYFEYLYYMVFFLSVADGNNIFMRTFININHIFNNLNLAFKFSGFVFYLLFLFPFIEVTQKYKNIANRKKYILIRFLVLIFALYLTVMAVRSSGYHYSQHNSFAVPFIFALSLYFIKNVINFKNDFRKIYIFVFNIILTITLFFLPIKGIVIEDWSDMFLCKNIKDEAEYIDNVLDKLDEKTYVFLGSCGHHILGFTRHSPKGKYAFQVRNWNAEKLPNFYESIVDNVKNAKLVVFDSYFNKKLQYQIEPILNNAFTTDIPNSLKGIKKPYSRYKIYFSKKIS